MSEGMYRNVKKEMQTLLKIEGGMSPAELGGRKSVGNRVTQSGEAAARLGNTSPSPIGYMSQGGDDDDMQLGTGDLASAEQMMRALTERTGLPYRNIKDYDLADEAKVERLTSYILSAIAREKRIFAVEERENPPGKPILTVAISDPMDITVVDDIRLMLPTHEIEPVVCNEDDIVHAIDKYYGVGEEDIESAIGKLQEQEGGQATELGRAGEVQINLEELANHPPVVRLVNLLLIQAVKDRASDLHIEPFGGMIRIRYRVDGVLREIPSPPKSLQLGLLSRLKVMAQLNISETRRPQDGRIRLNVEGREIDLRVACVPTVHGESIVMRVLDKGSMMIGIAQLGMQKEVLEVYMKRAQKPNGIMLVTGPTGSGKTTTLYATLQSIYDPAAKFITVEDPVEFELPGIVQVNINAKVGLTFAACLRSILRQDPDVILVGEIRDTETAQISIQAALTGHFVMSTLHTNSAAATITRLVDMGIEPFLLTSTLECIVGQRLLRTICPSCKSPYFPTDEELGDFGVSREEVEDISFYQGRGCDDCNFSGYKGRLGIYEVMEVTDPMKELIIQRATTDDLHAMAVHEGMITLRQDGWLKICLGMTTFDVVTRHTTPETEDSIRAEMDSVRRSLSLISKMAKQRETEEKGFNESMEADSSGNQSILNVEETSGNPDAKLIGH